MQLCDIDYAKLELTIAALAVDSSLTEDVMMKMTPDELLAHVESVNASLRPIHVLAGALQDHTRRAKLRAQELCDHPADMRNSGMGIGGPDAKRDYWCTKCGANI